jgi:hypothetical protein
LTIASRPARIGRDELISQDGYLARMSRSWATRRSDSSCPRWKLLELPAIRLLLTDVAAVQDGYDTPQARPIRRATPAELRVRAFPAGSMGPKVDAACRFAETTGKAAAIGRFADAAALLTGDAGTVIAR